MKNKIRKATKEEIAIIKEMVTDITAEAGGSVIPASNHWKIDERRSMTFLREGKGVRFAVEIDGGYEMLDVTLNASLKIAA